MEGKRKISIRKVLQAFTTLVVTLGCIVAIVGASRIDDKKLLKNVAVHIKNNKKYHFIEQNEILDEAIGNRHVDILHTPLGRLDLQSMEEVLRADPWIADVQVFVDNDATLNIFVTQRIPVMRVFPQHGNSFYIDSSLSIMPLSPNYVYYTTVVANFPDALADTSARRLKKELYSLVCKIQSDTFWNNQISQIDVDTNYTFDLIPVLGNQKIVFGDTSQMTEKFDNLFAFYNKVLNRIGWDKYDVLDLRFRNQVVASPSLPYHGPVDHAVATMNWITSIVETEAKNEAVDSTANDDDDQPAGKPVATDTATAHSPATPKPAEKKEPPTKKDGKADKKDKDEPKDKKKGKQPDKHR